MASKLILARAALFKPLITIHSERLSVNLFLFQKLFLFSSVRTPNQFRMAGSREKSLESNPVLQIEGTFLDFEPLSGVKVTMREATIQDPEEPVQTGSDQFPAPDAELML